MAKKARPIPPITEEQDEAHRRRELRKKPRKPDDGLRAVIRANLTGVQWTTIETGAVQLGVPDMNYLLEEGIEGWIECKATDANAVKMRPHQVGWHARRARYGGRSWIAVRRRHDGGARLGAAVDELWIFANRDVQALNSEGLACGRGRLLGEGGPKRWNWPLLRALLAT